MYEEHDTDARTHARTPPTLMESVTPTRSSGGDFGILPFCFITMKKIIHPPSSDILAYLLPQPAGA